ncbi:hypothetical protein [Nostoc sp. LEGE 12450]|uniref:hypothetical protein n=1 Tax=Nostoc sp. LEGE 12450 TaxID=1828643 RepID=UPI00187E05B2|nr:hypothetical protein [Nostoc sp. LEGE 12450]MBE8989952.1 hypothetical protein [Nostoc sp. LEGE 12450]
MLYAKKTNNLEVGSSQSIFSLSAESSADGDYWSYEWCFAAAAYALASECGCDMGCPRCLHSTACPGQNEPLFKDVDLFNSP